MSKKSDSPKGQRIKVFARCRPMSSAESVGSTSMMEVIPEENRLVLKDRHIIRNYSFDQVFSPQSDQVAVYNAVVEPLIQEVLKGYHCTVFAYGQTGTGKTYTMEGKRTDTNCSWKDDPTAGIIPRSLHQLFEELNQMANVEFSVRASFLEIYNEDVYDLLSSDFTKLRLYDDSNLKDSVTIKNLEEVLVASKDEVYTILERGTAKRHTAETKLNACSSRSHTVFTVAVNVVEKSSTGADIERCGKLNLVDLAGSENVRRSGSVDKRAREAGSINQSLLTLGRVIKALIEKQAHVPYRESKLTRILQYSLSGHAKTSLIATVSPALCNFEESISTLDYAAMAKTIDLNPELTRRILQKGLVQELTRENDSLRMQNEQLKKDLEAAMSNNGFCIDPENYVFMTQRIDCMDKEIKALKAENLKLQQEAFQVAEDTEELHAKVRRTQALAFARENVCDGLRELSKKHFADLYEMVGSYSGERMKFSNSFKEAEDRLAHELNEHKKKTNYLRETLGDELQSLLNRVLTHLNGLSTSESQRASDLSQDLKSIKDSLFSEFDGFLSWRLPYLLHDLNAEYASVEEWVTNIHMSLKEKVDQHVHVLNNQISEQRMLLGMLKDVLQSFFENHDAAILEYHNKVEYYKGRLDQAYFASMKYAVDQSMQASNHFDSMKYERDQTMQCENISKFEDNAVQLRTFQEPLDKWDGLIKTTEVEIAQFVDVADDIKTDEFFQKRKSNTAFGSQLTSALDDLKKSEINNYEKVANKIESRNLEAQKNVEMTTSLVDGIASISKRLDKEFVQGKLAIQEDNLAYLRGVCVESEESYFNAASQQQAAILQKDLEIETFIANSSVKDISTGTTPQQRVFQSVRIPNNSSPYRGFLCGLYNAWHEWHSTFKPVKENDESNCSGDGSFINYQDISLESDVYELNQTDSSILKTADTADSSIQQTDSSIMPETSLDDEDEASNKENKGLNLPKENSVQFSEPLRQASPLGSCISTSPLGSCISTSPLGSCISTSPLGCYSSNNTSPASLDDEDDESNKENKGLNLPKLNSVQFSEPLRQASPLGSCISNTSPEVGRK